LQHNQKLGRSQATVFSTANKLTNMEPANLNEWKLVSKEKSSGRLFTCGRPGRATFGRARRLIPVDVIDEWTRGLPSAETLNIVSLLGQKKDGFSEFTYYPFRSAKEDFPEKPTLETWLNQRHARRFIVHEFPTTDAQGIPAARLEEIVRHTSSMLANGDTVLVLDSAGAERTARVCHALGWSPE